MPSAIFPTAFKRTTYRAPPPRENSCRRMPFPGIISRARRLICNRRMRSGEAAASRRAIGRRADRIGRASVPCSIVGRLASCRTSTPPKRRALDSAGRHHRIRCARSGAWLRAGRARPGALHPVCRSAERASGAAYALAKPASSEAATRRPTDRASYYRARSRPGGRCHDA